MDSLELFEFFVEGKNQNESHVLLHITEPATADEMKKGYFFAIVEMNQCSITQIEHIQQLIDDLESGYYETDEHDLDSDSDAFEMTLEFLNKRSGQILSSNSEVHCIVGVVRDTHISFSYHGSPHAVVFYVQKDGLAQMSALDDKKEEGKQLFSSVLQGQLNPGDYFFVATPHVTDYFSYDRIQKIIQGRKTKDAALHIQKVLKDLREDGSYGGVLIHLIEELARAKTGRAPRQNIGAAASLQHLMQSEKHTRDTLTPPLLSNLKSTIAAIRDSAQTTEDRIQKQKTVEKQAQTSQKYLARGRKRKTHLTTETNYNPRPIQQETLEHQSIFNILLIGTGRALVQGTIGFGKIILWLCFALWRGVVSSIILITNKNNGRKEMTERISRGFHIRKQWITHLSLLSKILFIGILLDIIIFGGSIIYTHIEQQRTTAQNAYQHTIQSIIKKKQNAEANHVYGNDTDAMSLLQKAQSELALLPKSTTNQKNEKNSLTASIARQLHGLQKMKIVSPKLVANLTKINTDAKTTGLATIDNTLIAYGPQDPLLYIVHTLTGLINKKNHANIMGLVANNTPKEQNTTVFLGKNNTIGLYDKKTGAVAHGDISFPNNPVNITSLFVYNLHLYTLDTTNNQIYRHARTQTGFEQGTPWITRSGVNLSGATSLAIDGDIYVTKNNGTILKFARGIPQPFTIRGLDPALSNPTEIWTYYDVPDLYILDPATKRVVVLDKSGNLVQQYTSLLWKHPTGMIVDVANNIIYILDSNKVYSFEL